MDRLIRASVLCVSLLAIAVGPSPAVAEALVMRLAAISTLPLLLPHDITLTPDGKYVVVADMGHNRVVLLDAQTLSPRHVIGEDIMSFPHDVTFDPQGRLLVADSGNDRILVYSINDTQAQLLTTWEGLDGPEGVSVTPDGTVYATLVGNDSVVKLKDGEVVSSTTVALGMAFDRPHDIEVTTGAQGLSIIVADSGNHRLVVLSDQLTPLYEISTWDPPFSEPKYISVDAQGVIYVADQYNNRVRVFNANSQPLGQFAHNEVKLPEGVFAKDDRVWVSDTEGGRVLLYQRQQTD